MYVEVEGSGVEGVVWREWCGGSGVTVRESESSVG